jgi:hypothetical protein
VFNFEVAQHGLNNNGWIIGTKHNVDGSTTPVVSVRGRTTIAADSLFASPADRAGWTIEKFVGLNDNNEILAVAKKGDAEQFVILIRRPE